MFNFFKKFSVIAVLVAVLLFSAVMAVTIPLASAKDDYQDLTVKGFRTSVLEVSDGNTSIETTDLYTYFRFNVTGVLGSNKIKSFWINVGDADVGAIDIHFAYYSSLSSSGNTGYGFGKKTAIDLTGDTDQWVNLMSTIEDKLLSTSYITFALNNSVFINEVCIVAVNSKGNLVQITPTLDEIGCVVGDKLNVTLSSPLRNPMPSLLEGAQAILDEQHTFDISLIETDENGLLTYPVQELGWLASQRTAYYLDALTLTSKGALNEELSGKTGILGAEIVTLGTLMFGNNAFGLHFFSLLAGIGAIVVFALLMKKLTKTNWIFACGLAVFVGLLAMFTSAFGVIIAPIIALLIVTSAYFASKYILSSLSNGRVINLVLSGVAFSLAILCKSTAIIFLPFIIAGICYRAIKDCKLLKQNNKSVGSYLIEVIVPVIIGFVLFALITACFANLIVSKTLVIVMGESSLIKTVFSAFGKSFLIWL